MRIPPEILLAICETQQPDYSGEEKNSSRWCFSCSIVKPEFLELRGSPNYEHDNGVLVMEETLTVMYFDLVFSVKNVYKSFRLYKAIE